MVKEQALLAGLNVEVPGDEPSDTSWEGEDVTTLEMHGWEAEAHCSHLCWGQEGEREGPGGLRAALR